jgi:FAD-dependent oxidoreductase
VKYNENVVHRDRFSFSVITEFNDNVIQAAAIVYPKTEQEILDVVATAAKNNQKIEVDTRSCHSICKLVCPGGNDGIFLSTLNYSAIIAINETTMTATVQSGIGLTTFLDTVAAKNLALPIAPYWDGLTMGGLLGTGGHGSTLFGRGSAVHDYVKSMKLVIPATAAEGYSKTITLTEECDDPADLNAAKLSLGVLGVVSEVTLQLEPLFKRKVTKTVRNDMGLEDAIIELATAYEFGDVHWYPSQYTVVYRLDERVPVTTSGDGVFRYLGFQPIPGAQIGAVRATGKPLPALG